jgi:hypothetical protein
MAGFTIRDARDDDVDGIARLSFAEDPAGAHDLDAFRRAWGWLHRENPCEQGKVLVGVDGTDDGNVLGHYAIVPFAFRRKGQPFTTGGFLCRLLVAESSRNTMLFPQLEMQMIKGYGDWGMDFAYGLINRPPVLKAHLYFKFKDVIALPVMARPIRVGKLIEQVVRNKALAAIMRLAAPIGDVAVRFRRRPRRDPRTEVVQVEQFSSEHAEALDRLTRPFPLIAQRTVETLNWRFARPQDRGYRIFLARGDGELRGYVVTRAMPMKELTTVAVVDLLFAEGDEAAGDALLARAIDEAYAAGADVCACLVNPLGRYFSFLKKRGFFKTPESFTLILHEPPNSPKRVCDIPPADWHLTWFDHDYV